MIGVGVARLSAALALIAGLFGMHGFVVVDAEHVAGPTPMMSSAAPTHPPALAPMTAMHDEAVPTVDAPGTSHAGTLTASHDRTPHPGAHQTLHLCLAVLAALLALIAFAGLIWSVGRRDVTTTLVAVGNGHRQPPQRPPPMSVRLAQLCVMRN